MKKQKKRRRPIISLLLLYAMILLATLLLTVAGGMLYVGVTERRAAQDQQRTTLAYVQSKVQGADDAESISIAAGPEGQALVLAEADSDYETRIYLYQGHLMEEVAVHHSAFAPDSGMEIGTTESFQIRMAGKQLMEITADGRQALICLRSEGGVTVAP